MRAEQQKFDEDDESSATNTKNHDKRKQHSGPSNSSSDTRIGGAKRPRRRYRRKAEIPFPELGKPGARDVPFRAGLSGASSQKYLKYLNAE